MIVKKENEKKQPSKRTARKKSAKKDKRIKKEIKEAVDKIPGLIFESAVFNRPAENLVYRELASAEPRFWPEANRQEQRRRSMMWTGVIVLTLIVFGLWLFNLRAVFGDTLRGKTTEKSLWEEARTGWKEIKQPATK